MSRDYVVTTVTAPASSFDMTTLPHLRDDLGLTNNDLDRYFKRIITQCSQAVAQQCNRIFAQQSYQDVIHLAQRTSAITRGGRSPLILANAPLSAVASVVEDGTALVVDTDYEIDFQNAFLYRLDDCQNPRNWPAVKIVVNYTAGWVLPGSENPTLPADLEDAVIRMVKARYLARDRDPYLKGETVPGVLEQQFWIDTGANGNFPPDIADLLDNYRTPVMA